jgi:hypothetical protein
MSTPSDIVYRIIECIFSLFYIPIIIMNVFAIVMNQRKIGGSILNRLWNTHFIIFGLLFLYSTFTLVSSIFLVLGLIPVAWLS